MTHISRIPEHAKKVFEGIRSDIYQWKQEMYDGSYRTFEISQFINGSFVVGVTQEGEILITHQEQPARKPFIGLPGGAFDRVDEDPLDCAKREFLEETGYASDTWEPWITSEGTNNIIAYTHFYIARNIYQVSNQRLDPGEKIAFSFIDFDGFLELAEHPDFANWTIARELLLAKLHPEKYTILKRLLLCDKKDS